ncbi:helix-turn-helix domain-containing protein [Caldicellulosiruptor acetigenus]|uniref:helix-turn-helix domain-containing protein n=1 Tax=Caldicellulosiruptor acetigenus TaxID=301953 RepID=UPI001E4417F1|nr:helix-turn-helix transcriptional regulator [Caldicellulosiruptor acetigenus]
MKIKRIVFGGGCVNLFRFRLKELREEKNISRSDLAEILGVSTQTIANYENGHREPNFDTLLKIAEYFDVTVDYLVGRSDYRTVEEQISKRSKFEKTVGESLKEAIMTKKLKGVRWDEKLEKEIGDIIEEHIEPLLNDMAMVYFLSVLPEKNDEFIRQNFKKHFALLLKYFSTLKEALQDNIIRNFLVDDYYVKDKIENVSLLALENSLINQDFVKQIEMVKQKVEVAEGLIDSLETMEFDFLKVFMELIRFFSYNIACNSLELKSIYYRILKEYNKEGDSGGSKNA